MKILYFTRFNLPVAYVCALALYIYPFSNIYAQSSTHKLHQAHFTGNDPFQTSVFLENKGIIDPYKGEKILYYAGHDHVHAFFTEKGVVYKLQDIDQKKYAEIKRDKEKEARKKRKAEGEEREDGGLPLLTSIVQMEWVGANPHPQIEVENKGEGYYTYLKQEASGYKTLTTEGYKKIIYHNIYPGIDAEYTFPEKGGMEYALIVQPGADAGAVKIVYKGAIKKMSVNDAGDIVIHTQGGDLIEHAPLSYTGGQTPVASRYVLNNNYIQFQFPSGYNNHTILTIDPWTTALNNMPPENIGMKVDFDFLGNLFVYGTGPTDNSDVTDFFQVAKYTAGGTFLWEFGGQVPAASWTTAESGGGVAYNYSGGFRVDKVSGKSYVSQGFNFGGTQTVRLTAGGVYDNFISTVDPNFREAWGIMYNCSSGSIINVGGGTNSDLNMGIINTTTAAVSTSNITGITGSYYQDILCAAYDSSGNMYAIMNDGLFVLPYTNTIYKVNAGFNGYIWAANSTYTTFSECDNQPYWSNLGGNWNNCLAANGSYLYYYDGYNVAAFSFATGAMVGTPYAIAAYAGTPMYQGGIAVDNCNNIYVGGVGAIKTFTFNGATFTPHADISLPGAYAGDEIHDVSLDNTTNVLYFAGTSVIGTVIATPSIACIAANPFKVAVANFCDSAVVHVSPNAGLSPLLFTYILFDTAYNVISQQPNLNDTVVGFGGLSNGQYFVQVQWNANCGGAAVNDTINLHCASDSISPDTTICLGASVIISARGLPGGGAYFWQPVGSTDSVITVTPTVTTTYYCTYTPPVGNVWTDSVTVTIATNATVTVNDTTVCKGDSATLTAVPSLPGGTYLWSPGAFTTSSITVSPATSTTYTVTYSGSCSNPVDTGRVTVQSIPVLTPVNDTICQGGAGQVSVTPSIPGGTYLWSPGGQTTQAISAAPLVTGNYTYTVTYSLGLCPAIDSAMLTVDSMPVLTTANDTVCEGNTANLSATSTLGGGTYLWTPGNLTTATIAVAPNISTPYSVTYKLAACNVTGNATAVVDPMPVLTMTGDSICIGSSGQVSANPSVAGGTYLWAPVNGTTGTIMDQPVATTVYSVTYTDALCSVSGSATITVLPVPTVSVAGDTVCHGTTVQLTAVPSRAGGTYSWAPGGYTAQVISFLPLATNTYTVTYTIAGCGTAVDSAEVKVLPVPTLTTTDAAFCQGNSGQLAVIPSIAGGTYLWLPGGVPDSTLTVSPGATSTYTVSYNLNGCAATDSATATVYPNPVVNVLPVGATCGEPNGSATATASAGSAPYTYLWSNSETTASISPVAGNQAYSVSVEDIHQCTATGSAAVTQSTAVVALATGINEKCPGYSNAMAAATGTGGVLPYTFIWSNGQPTDSAFALPPASYSVTITDVTGCSASASVTVAPAAPDTFTSTTTPTSCYGPEYEDGSVTVMPLGSLRAPYQYSLSGGPYQASGTFTGLAAGIYSADVEDDSGCITPVNNITVPEAPQGFLSISPADTNINIDQTVQLTPALSPYSDSAINVYSWSPGFGLSCTNCPSPVVSSYAAQTTYTLTITYNGHCTATDTATVWVNGVLKVFIPDVFTPNHDGNNDIFYVYGDGIKSLNLKVFNRWGEKVFEGNSQFDGWDGTYKGQLQPQNVYIYEATIYSLDGQTIFRKGSVTLVR